MSKRLQVVVADAEIERYAQTAEAAGLSMSEWARQTLRTAVREASSGDVEAKLAVIRRAAGNRTGAREVDIETMLAETEAARSAGMDAGIGTADA
jgi:uncharacterized membrane protein